MACGAVEVAVAEAQSAHSSARQSLTEVAHARPRKVVAAEVERRQLHDSGA